MLCCFVFRIINTFYVLAFFLAEMCFECTGGTSHRDVSFEHTEQINEDIR